MNNEKGKTDNLNEKVNKVEKSKDIITIIKDYKDIIRTKKKNIMSKACYQENVF